MGYTTKFSGSLTFDIPLEKMSDELQQRIEWFLESMCDDCIVPLSSNVCVHCLKGLKPSRVPLRINNICSNGCAVRDYIEWDGSEKADLVFELLKAFVMMVRLYEPTFGLTGEMIANGERAGDVWKIITKDGVPKKEMIAAMPKQDEKFHIPVGLRPRHIVLEQRYEEVWGALKRYLEANMSIPTEWVEEYNELLKTLENYER